MTLLKLKSPNLVAMSSLAPANFASYSAKARSLSALYFSISAC